MPREPTIFVQIASYRDPECQWTVKDLFDKAGHPGRVTVGICWQCFPDQDQDCFLEPSPRPAQTKTISVLPSESLGVCWARAKTQELFGGEDYVLMIDSHMRFVQGWDTALIAELARCPSPKSFLSTYPPGYKPPNNLVQSPKPVVMRAKPFTPLGDIRFEGETLDGGIPEKPLRGAFLAGGFVFAPGSFVREVPYDPHIYFDHEEITIAARAYTHGWDVFSPPGTFVYHYYHEPKKGETRALHWSDNRDWGKLQLSSRARYNYLLAGIPPQDQPDALTDIGKYGLGEARTIKDFQNFSGIDFKNKIVSERALTSQFVEGLDRYRRKNAAEELKALPGTVLPPFRLQDDVGHWHERADFSGAPRILCLLPTAFDPYIREFVELYAQMRAQFQATGVELVLVFPQADANSGFCTVLGLGDFIRETPFSFVIDGHNIIVGFYNNRNAHNHIHDLLRAAQKYRQ